jgi:hypothetical protein
MTVYLQLEMKDEVYTKALAQSYDSPMQVSVKAHRRWTGVNHREPVMFRRALQAPVGNKDKETKEVTNAGE